MGDLADLRLQAPGMRASSRRTPPAPAPAGPASPPIFSTIALQLGLLTTLLGVDRSASDKLQALLGLLCRASLDRPRQARYSGLSHINADGFPFQWSFVLANGPPSVRFLCECGRPGLDVADRNDLAIASMREAITIIGIPHPKWLEPCILRHIVPDRAAVPAHWESGIWFAVGASARGVGMKMYFNMDRGTPRERWLAYGRILQSFGRDEALARLCELSDQVSGGSMPDGLCVELQPDGQPGRIKLYFASEAVSFCWLRRWYSAFGASTCLVDLLHFLRHCRVPYKRFPSRGLFVSIEVDAAQKMTFKTDVPVCRWAIDAQTFPAVVSLAERLALPTYHYRNWLATLGIDVSSPASAAHQVVSLGYELSGNHHINVYCRPPA
jgi:hypothetical protein